MRHLIVLLAVVCLADFARAQSGNYEVIQVDPAGSNFTGEVNGQLRTFRVRPGVEVTINGVKASFAGLEVGMKVQVSSAEPGVATRIVANGLQTQKPAAPGRAPIAIGAQPLREIDAKIPANAEDGFGIANVAKGSKISLQYKGGKWKSWGNLATEDPDAEKPNEYCRLAIALPSRNGKAGKVLALVPGETAKRPFVYEVPLDFPGLVLRINDTEGSFEKNPGKVEYSVKVFPPGK